MRQEKRKRENGEERKENGEERKRIVEGRRKMLIGREKGIKYENYFLFVLLVTLLKPLKFVWGLPKWKFLLGNRALYSSYAFEDTPTNTSQSSTKFTRHIIIRNRLKKNLHV